MHVYATDGEGSTGRMIRWDQLGRGVLDEPTVRAVSDENVQLGVPKRETRIERLPGKTSVTADHGIRIGDRIAPFDGPMRGHPPTSHTIGVRKVSCFVLDGEQQDDSSDGTSATAGSVTLRESTTVLRHRGTRRDLSRRACATCEGPAGKL